MKLNWRRYNTIGCPQHAKCKSRGEHSTGRDNIIEETRRSKTKTNDRDIMKNSCVLKLPSTWVYRGFGAEAPKRERAGGGPTGIRYWGKILGNDSNK